MSAADDAAALAKAYKGLGTDEKVVIDILTHRTQDQIEQIKAAFQSQFGKDLIKETHSELSGNFLKVIDGILKGPTVFDAETIHHAISGLGTDEKALVEVLVGRTNEETRSIAQAYEALYGKSLETDISGDTSGDFKAILLGLIHNRNVGHKHDNSPEADAEALFQAGENKLGTNEKVFIDIFTRSSYVHLKEVFHIYENKHKHHSIVQALENEFSGDVLYGLKAIAEFVLNPGDFYAQLVFAATKGLGTDDNKLIRVIVGQRHHLEDIKTAFSTRYAKSLHNFVLHDTSGDYRHALLEIIGNADIKMG